ncbi:PPOX class F420-dependent enzyme [Actinoplanes lobatus]|uniref:PPOX class F420-dependent enzyme n=1 Tax=Actinoplanes lobatus TaxID=113568 RepID=A0A7W7ML85_9ACTN|nr:TIGR03618 family F420-dependent PPOX class oxidoreductase [Actinoplanes lobatus]MBB4754504.1 PPOX class probable F420-dependent enzyme [Actinoplanes lobatus]GGN65980.1 PPOX class F420-dependent enzyme [Actinoplanes lobatus]GIE40421.1 PPOX class F420-dependent enzyme [Actinoplanes lobatus]
MSGVVPLDSPALAEFWTERHLCTLTTLRADGSPHVVAVGATLDQAAGLARVISFDTSTKVRNVRRGQRRVAICQIDGRRWSTIEGLAVVLDDPSSVAEAERRYAGRYRTPRPNPSRVVIEVTITRVLGSATLLPS